MDAKRRYNKWLFKRYGTNVGMLYEKIPMKYKISPLWSPSIYQTFVGDIIVKALIAGMNDGLEYGEKKRRLRRKNEGNVDD